MREVVGLFKTIREEGGHGNDRRHEGIKKGLL